MPEFFPGVTPEYFGGYARNFIGVTPRIFSGVRPDIFWGVTPGIFSCGSTNPVEDRGQRELGSESGSPLVRSSTQFANE
jgi:hypothetical protein